MEISQHQKTLSKKKESRQSLPHRDQWTLKALCHFLGVQDIVGIGFATTRWLRDRWGRCVMAGFQRNWCGTRTKAKAFEDLKKALANAPALGLPDFKKHFHIYVAERGGFASAVVTQTVSNKHKPCAYYWTRLDKVVRGMHPCAGSLAATAYAIEESASLILMHNATVYVSHEVLALLNPKNSCLTAARLARYETLLTQPNLTVERCETVNPADFAGN